MKKYLLPAATIMVAILLAGASLRAPAILEEEFSRTMTGSQLYAMNSLAYGLGFIAALGTILGAVWITAVCLLKDRPQAQLPCSSRPEQSEPELPHVAENHSEFQDRCRDRLWWF